MIYSMKTIDHTDKDWLIEQYVKRARSMPDIAREVGRHTKTIEYWLRKHNIPTRPRGHHLDKVSWWAQGKPHNLLGTKRSPETRRKISESLKRHYRGEDNGED